MPSDSRPLLAVTRRLTDAVEARLDAHYRVRRPDIDRPPAPEVLLSLAQGADGVLACPGDPLNATVIGALPAGIRVIATVSVGYDHVDIAAAAARGIPVTNTPGVLTEATAEIALLLLLGAARRATEGIDLIRSGRWTGIAPTQLLGVGLNGKRLGILGMGRIGQAVADRARAFGMTIHYANRRRLPPELERNAVFHADPDALLRHADFLSLHCPATPETTGWLDARRIALLPRGAIVVNTARGSVVVDDALIAALRDGHLAAAGLDVFNGEPALDPRYLALPNAFLLPHLGSATVETRNAMGFTALDNLDAVFAGREPPNRVN